MIKIAPSILSADFSKLGEEIANLSKDGADYIHIDVMDCHFVPNMTIGPVVVNSVAKVATKPLDIHLMVEDNNFFIDLSIKLRSYNFIKGLDLYSSPPAILSPRPAARITAVLILLFKDELDCPINC